MFEQKIGTGILLAGVAGLLVGCASPAIIGDWEGQDDVAGRKNELELEEDGKGEATVYFFFGDDLFEADYDVEWADEGDGEFELDLECEGDCSSFDFKMDCEMNADQDEMDCDGDERFSDYVFEWVRQ